MNNQNEVEMSTSGHLITAANRATNHYHWAILLYKDLKHVIHTVD